jgi:hypothetical protein
MKKINKEELLDLISYHYGKGAYNHLPYKSEDRDKFNKLANKIINFVNNQEDPWAKFNDKL